MPFRGNSCRQAKIMWAPYGRLPPGAVVAGTEAPEIGSVEDQADVLRRRTGAQGMLAAIFGDRGQRARVPQGPAQRRTNVPAGREVVSLLRVHVHITAVHRDDAGNVRAFGQP